ncbi:hypothetical protein SAMN05216263_104269 [Metapseudomonas otitidis]|nr:hypothetical protein SAMN05216263_104269 [Pseudomonas otitidis]
MAAPGSAAPIVLSIPTLHGAAPCCAPLVALARNALRSAEARPTAVPEAGYCPSRTAACACVVSVALAVPGSPDRRSARAAALAGLHLVRGGPGAAHIDAVADLLLWLVRVLSVDQLASHHPALQRLRTERVGSRGVDDSHGRGPGQHRHGTAAGLGRATLGAVAAGSALGRGAGADRHPTGSREVVASLALGVMGWRRVAKVAMARP